MDKLQLSDLIEKGYRLLIHKLCDLPKPENGEFILLDKKGKRTNKIVPLSLFLELVGCKTITEYRKKGGAEYRKEYFSEGQERSEATLDDISLSNVRDMRQRFGDGYKLQHKRSKDGGVGSYKWVNKNGELTGESCLPFTFFKFISNVAYVNDYIPTPEEVRRDYLYGSPTPEVLLIGKTHPNHAFVNK